MHTNLFYDTDTGCDGCRKISALSERGRGKRRKGKKKHESSEDFMMPFVQNGYIMYTNENGTEKERTKLRDMLDQDAYWEWLTNYKMLYPYIDYEWIMKKVRS